MERGGEEVVVNLPVQDLHSITPSEYVFSILPFVCVCVCVRACVLF